MSQTNAQRLPAEALFQTELDALIAAETDPVPTGWRMSPRSVLTYITGGTSIKGCTDYPQIYGKSAGWWRSPLQPWSPTGRCCSSANPAPPNPG